MKTRVAEPRSPRAKGINFRSFIGACRRLLGPEAIDEMAALLPAELGKQVQLDNFVTGNWYPLADFRALHVAAQTLSQRGLELACAIGRESAAQDFRGIYRVLTFVLSPEFLIKRTPAIWMRYYDVGEVTMEASSGSARALFSGATGFDRVLWQDVIGGCTGVLEVCGAKNVKMTIEGGGGDEDHLALTASWD
jgi:hypothetical protein